jgi:hypothetical protein
VPGRSAIDGGIPRILGDMRGRAGLSEVKDEVGAVISLVGSERQTPGQPAKPCTMATMEWIPP